MAVGSVGKTLVDFLPPLPAGNRAGPVARWRRFSACTAHAGRSPRLPSRTATTTTARWDGFGGWRWASACTASPWASSSPCRLQPRRLLHDLSVLVHHGGEVAHCACSVPVGGAVQAWTRFQPHVAVGAAAHGHGAHLRTLSRCHVHRLLACAHSHRADVFDHIPVSWLWATSRATAPTVLRRCSRPAGSPIRCRSPSASCRGRTCRTSGVECRHGHGCHRLGARHRYPVLHGRGLSGQPLDLHPPS